MATGMNCIHTAPLNVQRDQLIQRIEAALEERRQKREEAKSQQTEKLETLLEGLSAFERIELIRTIRAFRERGTWDRDPADREATNWRSDPDNNPLNKVNPDEAYERFLSVLRMSTDETIEVKPDEEVYHLI